MRVAGQNDRKAFDQIVRHYQGPVRRFLLNLTLGNQALADDLAQDTFVKAWLAMGKYRAEAALQTWLMRIAYNVFYDYKRGQHHELTGQDACLQHNATPIQEPGAAGFELRNDIYQALSLLNDDERTCITLQLIDGEPIERIALITGMPQGTVKSHLHRGKERLANYLRQNGYDR